MDRSPILNNAGALALSNGHVAVALELFRGALESKLAFERTHPPDGGGKAEPEPLERCMAPACVLRAEAHLSQIEAYSTPNAIEDTYPVLEAVQEPAIPYEIQGYSPYVCQQPFELPLNRTASTQLTSATIVFNLGLVHQLVSKSSAKATAFYEIAAALLSGEDPTIQSALLRVALMNNYGALSYLNGEGEILVLCMEHLSRVLRAPHPVIATEVEGNIHRNITWFLAPPHGGSPAA
jgi:hypothetical protein